MRISQEDVIFAKGLGVALDAPEDAEAELRAISGRLEAVSLDREEWRKAFLKMGASREKWKRRWTITFGVLLAWIVAAGFVAIALEGHLK